MAVASILIPLATNLISAGYGAVKEGQERKRLTAERDKWGAENEALFNKEYYSNYTERLDSLNYLKTLREATDRQSKINQASSVITGATPEYNLAKQQGINTAISQAIGGLAAKGQLHKDKIQERYLSRKQGLQNMDYEAIAQRAASAGNITSNALKSMGSLDWAGIIGYKGDKKDKTETSEV